MRHQAITFALAIIALFCGFGLGWWFRPSFDGPGLERPRIERGEAPPRSDAEPDKTPTAIPSSKVRVSHTNVFGDNRPSARWIAYRIKVETEGPASVYLVGENEKRILLGDTRRKESPSSPWRLDLSWHAIKYAVLAGEFAHMEWQCHGIDPNTNRIGGGAGAVQTMLASDDLSDVARYELKEGDYPLTQEILFYSTIQDGRHFPRSIVVEPTP